MEPHFYTLLNTVYFQFYRCKESYPEQNRLSNTNGLRITAHLNSVCDSGSLHKFRFFGTTLETPRHSKNSVVKATSFVLFAFVSLNSEIATILAVIRINSITFITCWVKAIDCFGICIVPAAPTIFTRFIVNTKPSTIRAVIDLNMADIVMTCVNGSPCGNKRTVSLSLIHNCRQRNRCLIPNLSGVVLHRQ